jgi:hypothetical protein
LVVILLMANILLVIDGYSLTKYWCLLMAIILLVIGGYSIIKYW